MCSERATAATVNAARSWWQSLSSERSDGGVGDMRRSEVLPLPSEPPSAWLSLKPSDDGGQSESDESVRFGLSIVSRRRLPVSLAVGLRRRILFFFFPLFSKGPKTGATNSARTSPNSILSPRRGPRGVGLNDGRGALFELCIELIIGHIYCRANSGSTDRRFFFFFPFPIRFFFLQRKTPKTGKRKSVPGGTAPLSQRRT